MDSMEKELLEVFEAAKKSADVASGSDCGSDGGSEEARCVDALKRLRDFPVTMQMLVSTQVGKRLRYLAKHPRENIRGVASDLLETWKKIVIEETARNNKKDSNPDGKHSMKIEAKSERALVVKEDTVKVEKFQSSEDMKVEKVSRSETVSVEKVDRRESVKEQKVSRSETVKVATVKMEKIGGAPIGPPKLSSMVKCNDALRDKFRELLLEAFSKVSSEADEEILDEVNACDPIRVAVLVESVMYEKLGRSNGAQKVKYRSIMFNLKDSNNPDLRRRVLLGHVKPERLIDMTPQEMASDQRKRENNQIKEKALFDCERAGAPKATTDQFKCGRCGQRKTTYYQLQTRSADEPMTTFVTCVNCNNHWKFC
ncbi:transcription elongation factor TFIIS-like [Tasmannia lanceolata]|uniref:transcription elongation factor TFIIS-like n=1 Tax=Tasmannia lanceolata TaxID=3420 RepID=UPI004064B571